MTRGMRERHGMCLQEQVETFHESAKERSKAGGPSLGGKAAVKEANAGLPLFSSGSSFRGQLRTSGAM